MSTSGKPQIRVKDKIEGAFDGAGVTGVAAYMQKHLESVGPKKLRKAVRELLHGLKARGDAAAAQVAEFYKEAFPRTKGAGRAKGALNPTLTVSKLNSVTVRFPAGFAKVGEEIPREERVIDGRRVVLLLGPAVDAAPSA